MATKDTLLLILQSGSRTTDQLIAALGKSYAAVHTSLRRLSRAGKVIETSNNVWALPGQQTAAPAPAPSPVAPPFPTVTQPATYAQATKLAPPQKKLRTKAILVVDMSGSMNSFRYEMAKSVNKTIAELKAQAYRTGIEVDASLYYFQNWRVTPQFRNVNVKEVQPIGAGWPAGGTPLFDAVELAINEHLQPERIDEEVTYLLITITDGDNNESRDNTGRTMMDLIRRVQTTDRWTITFEMPNGYKRSFCRNYGVPEGNCLEWEQTTKGFETAFNTRSTAVGAYMTNVTKGVRSSSTFYADLSSVDVNDLKKSLTNIQDRVKTFPVNAEADIKPFIEQKTGAAYETGSVFYQLTKPETIQDTKKIIIKEKQGRAMYAGNEARQVLGFPIGQDARVKPGNLANYDLFVQSTSVNRKLVRGTTVVHWPLALQ